MKKSSKFLSLLLAGLLAIGGAGCGKKGGGDVDLDSEGNIRPGPGGVTNVSFWYYGDENEVSVFNKLVADFNAQNEGVIKVNQENKGSEGYGENAKMALRQSKASVDILYVGDSDFKSYAELGYLEPLDKYLQTSQEVKIEEMWETSVNRFKYDVNTTTSTGPDAHYWGIPKDIGPTVIYYNETYFEKAGVTTISVAAEDLAKFNGGVADSRGKTKEQYGINGEVKEKGYFELDGKKYFNNQVPMSWDECVALATLVQESARKTEKKNNIYGYFTEWWFNYGWSVGGDCIEYVATDDAAYNGGYYDFTLMDSTKNYIVADDNAAGFTVNGNHYKAGEIISWQDKLVNTKAAASARAIRSEILQAVTEGRLNELPSQREAFIEFVRIGQKSDVVVDGSLKGYGICPSPTSIGGDAGKTAAFSTGNLAMLVDGRWNVVEFRAQMDGKYKWDVAPLPQYKTYDAEGNILTHGIQAGHSGSVALCINAKSTKKNAAWKFAEYIGGKTGQTAQSLSGFAIPSQKEIANSEVFLQSDKNPQNSIVFVRAAEYETPGDWWYLTDKLWIDGWAGVLNGDVRNGKKTLSQFETDEKYLKTWEQLKEYTKKK
ncbi:MAG: extracellular solute-binding protein [Candidatus Borkfalkiaceae bacterium]|nr:extracellular solute-binding protein [Christensenellaceae bacterium]